MKISQTLENSNKVMYISKMTENCVMTISVDGNIKYWMIIMLYKENVEWQEIYEFKISDVVITHSCLSKLKCFLAVVDNKKNLLLYRISNIDNENFGDLKIESFMTYEYKEVLNICKFSEDDRYLAVALDNGDISVSNSILFSFFSIIFVYNH